MKGVENFEFIPEEAARALEAIVGPDRITTDRAYCGADTGMGLSREIFGWGGISQDAACIVQPKTTQEVVGIVKVCNRYNVPYLPVVCRICAPTNPQLRKDIVIIDFVWMNKVEIDEKNMYAIVEPGVTLAQLQGEILDKDLYEYICGGGGYASVIADHVGYASGTGILNYRTDAWTTRRMSGVEWVSPEGELYRMGSLVEGDEHGYWHDGLGPSTIGLMKGNNGWGGGMGIVTRMVIKLYPFQPEKLVPEGIGCDSVVALPPRVRWYNITFQTEEALQKAMAEIHEAQICAAVNRVPVYWREIAKCRGDKDFRNQFWELWDKQTPETVAQTHILRVLIIGYTSLKHLECEERVLMDIVSENGGTPRKTRQGDEGTFFNPNTLDQWMTTGVFGLTTGSWESPRCIAEHDELFVDRLDKYEFKHEYLPQHREHPWHCSWALGRTRYTETHAWNDGPKIDPLDPKFDPGAGPRHLIAAFGKLGVDIIIGNGAQDLAGVFIRPIKLESPAYFDFTLWIDRFKKEFDPKGVSGPPFPYMMEAILAGLPPELQNEFKESAARAQAQPWKGNPEE
jgi:hypothetical protein